MLLQKAFCLCSSSSERGGGRNFSFKQHPADFRPHFLTDACVRKEQMLYQSSEGSCSSFIENF